MLRWLIRLLVIGIILAVAARVVSRMLESDEDFDDYDDIATGLEFSETPVEIDVSADDGAGASQGMDTQMASMGAVAPEASDGVEGRNTRELQATQAAESPTAQESDQTGGNSLIDVNGIGPTYASRLNEAGIYSLEELSRADPGELAEKMTVVGGREAIEGWITQAREMLAAGGNRGA